MNGRPERSCERWIDEFLEEKEVESILGLQQLTARKQQNFNISSVKKGPAIKMLDLRIF